MDFYWLCQVAIEWIAGMRFHRSDGICAATFDVLQRAQNNLARVVCQRGGRTDARPLAASQASSDIQDGGADVQDVLNASIFE